MTMTSNFWLDFSHMRPLVIGHRGASAHAPENTLAAFVLALDQGADGIEFDIKRCQTGEVVIMHDETVDRTTNGTGRVHEMTLSQLRELDAGSGEHAGERVPLLDEVFEQLGQRETASGKPFIFNVEVTNYPSPYDELELAVVEVVRRHKMESRVLFSSFNPVSVARLNQLAPEIPRAILYDASMPIFLRNVWLGPLVPHQFRHPHFNMVTPKMVQDLLRKNLRVNAWTVNAPEEMRRLIDCGVNGLIGDSPQTMRDVLTEPATSNTSIAANQPN